MTKDPIAGQGASSRTDNKTPSSKFLKTCRPFQHQLPNLPIFNLPMPIMISIYDNFQLNSNLFEKKSSHPQVGTFPQKLSLIGISHTSGLLACFNIVLEHVSN